MANRIAYSYFNRLFGKIRACGTVLLLVLVSISYLPGSVTAIEDMSKKRVLILHSYYQGYKWTDDEHAGIESVLRPVIGAGNVLIEYMDTKKVFGDLYSQRLFDVYELKYKNYRFDLIIVTDNNAFDFVRKYRDRLFRGTPVVFCGVNDIRESNLKGLRLFTGVNEETDFKSTIELLLKLHPKTKQIVFINEWTTTGEGVHEAFVKTIPHFEKTIKFRLLEDLKMDEILEQVQGLSPDSLVLYTSFSRDKSGRLFEYHESVSLVAQRCKVPIYTSHEFNLGYGVVGGLIVTGYDQGEAAAKMALRILEGENVEKIPVMMTSPKRHMFDYAQMRRFNITPADLPEGSIIINLPQTFYFKYKQWIHALIAFIGTLFLIISILLINIRKRKKTEQELKASHEQIRALAWRLTETEETERKKLSRELHDQVGQNLTILGVNLNLLRSSIPKDTVGLIHSRINDSVVVVKQTTERIRHLMSNLRSPVLDDYGLAAAIDLYGKQCAARTGIDIVVRGGEAEMSLPAHIENAMFRIVQESLTNVVKHAQATQVVISVSVTDERLYLSVEDNGVGYDMEELRKVDGDHGWGLVTMTERAVAVGGTCRIRSSPGLGTHVIVEVPL
jgi:signal transduction histidine kinase